MEASLPIIDEIGLICAGLYSSSDPLPEHFEASREIVTDDLKQSEHSLLKYIDKGVDLLARELVNACNRFKDKIRSLENSEFNDVFVKIFNSSIQDMLWIDFVFFDFLCTIGKESSLEADIQRKKSKARWSKWHHSEVKNNGQKIWSLWSLCNHEKVITNIAPKFLYILAYGLWHDIIKCKWERGAKNVPALTIASLVTTIKPVLCKDFKIETTTNSIACYANTGKIISSIPLVDPKLVHLICKSLKILPTLNGHRLLRWEVKTGFNQWIDGLEDPRLIRTSGGYEGIAHLIGAGCSHKGISEVKAMLQAQTFGNFIFPDGSSGNMISLTEIEKHKNKEPSKINLILGEFLFPNFAQFLPKGKQRRLVPIIDLPPLIGSKNTHAAQAMLQLLILEEFSNQSNRFATYGSILLSQDKLRELCTEAKLPKTSLAKVMCGWTKGDNLSKAFLMIDGDEYALSPEHMRVSYFLEHQGILRNSGSESGKKSAASKRKVYME